jgi:hypothetical protein
MTDVSDQPVFHLTPRELFDLFEAGCDKGRREEAWWGRHVRAATRKNELIGIMFTHALHIHHEAGDPVYDRDELRRAIEAMFKGVGPR